MGSDFDLMRLAVARWCIAGIAKGRAHDLRRLRQAIKTRLSACCQKINRLQMLARQCFAQGWIATKDASTRLALQREQWLPDVESSYTGAAAFSTRQPALWGQSVKQSDPSRVGIHLWKPNP